MAGDTLAQKGIERRKEHDLARTARFAAFGGFVAGPLMVTWYPRYPTATINPTSHVIELRQSIRGFLSRLKNQPYGKVSIIRTIRHDTKPEFKSPYASRTRSIRFRSTEFGPIFYRAESHGRSEDARNQAKVG